MFCFLLSLTCFKGPEHEDTLSAESNVANVDALLGILILSIFCSDFVYLILVRFRSARGSAEDVCACTEMQTTHLWLRTHALFRYTSRSFFLTPPSLFSFCLLSLFPSFPFDSWNRETHYFLSQSHPEVATTCNNIGNILRQEGRFEEALEEYSKAEAIFAKVYGESHPWYVFPCLFSRCYCRNQERLRSFLCLFSCLFSV